MIFYEKRAIWEWKTICKQKEAIKTATSNVKVEIEKLTKSVNERLMKFIEYEVHSNTVF